MAWPCRSPAHFYGMKSCRYITAVNGTPVQTIDDLIAVVQTIPDTTAVKLKCVDLQGQAMTYTLKTDLKFWPTNELKRDPTGKMDWVLVDRKSEEAPPASRV